MSRPDPSQSVRHGAPLAAAVATLVEALVLVGFFAFYVYEMAVGATDDLTRAAMSAALILVFGILLLVVAGAWRKRADWARTPTLLWNALLLPVAWSLHESDRTLLALAVGLLALVALGAALASPPRQPADDVS